MTQGRRYFNGTIYPVLIIDRSYRQLQVSFKLRGILDVEGLTGKPGSTFEKLAWIVLSSSPVPNTSSTSNFFFWGGGRVGGMSEGETWLLTRIHFTSGVRVLGVNERRRANWAFCDAHLLSLLIIPVVPKWNSSLSERCWVLQVVLVLQYFFSPVSINWKIEMCKSMRKIKI